MTRPPLDETPDSVEAAAFFVDRPLDDGRGGRTVCRDRGESVARTDLAGRIHGRGNALLGLGACEAPRPVVLVPRLPGTSNSGLPRVRLRSGSFESTKS